MQLKDEAKTMVNSLPLDLPFLRPCNTVAIVWLIPCKLDGNDHKKYPTLLLSGKTTGVANTNVTSCMS